VWKKKSKKKKNGVLCCGGGREGKEKKKKLNTPAPSLLQRSPCCLKRGSAGVSKSQLPLPAEEGGGEREKRLIEFMERSFRKNLGKREGVRPHSLGAEGKISHPKKEGKENKGEKDGPHNEWWRNQKKGGGRKGGATHYGPSLIRSAKSFIPNISRGRAYHKGRKTSRW